MNILLDTHIWLWSHDAPARLTGPVAEALADTTNMLWLSPVSIWECVLLMERGRIQVRPGGSSRTWVERALAEYTVREASLNREVALVSRELRLPHQDPADQFIAATAVVYELTLATADARLLSGEGYATLPNR